MKNYIRQIILFCFLFLVFIFNTVWAQKQGQEKVDSLEMLLKKHYTDDTAKINLLNDIAWELQSINPAKGIEYAQKARKMAEDLDYPLGIGESYLSTGVCYYSQSDDKVALDNYNKALKILSQINDKGTMATVNLNIGNIYFNKQDFTKTLEYYNIALELLKDIGDRKRCASVYGNIGNAYYVQCDYNKSLEYQYKAYELAVRSGNMKVQGNSLYGIGNIYTRLPDYPKALEHYIRALKVFEKMGNKKATANAYGGIGIVYYRQQQNTLALENFFKARTIAEEIGDKRGCASTLTNIGNVYIQQKDYKNALENHLRAYELFKSINSNAGMASALGNIGQVYTEQGNFDKALFYYQQAYTENVKVGNKSSQIFNLKGIGSLYLKMVSDTIKSINGDKKVHLIINKQECLDNAIKYAVLAVNLGKEVNEIEPMIEAYTTISKAYQLKNDWKKAFYYADSSQVLKDSVFSKENQIKITEIGAKQEVELHQKEVQIIALKNKHQKIAIIAISICLVSVLVILLLIYRALRIKRKSNQNLEAEVKKRTLEIQDTNIKLEKANLELLRLEEAKAEFLKLISHEIRTPLNGIIGFTHLLKEELVLPEFSEIVYNIDKSVNRLERFSIAALLITELRNKNITLHYTLNSLKAMVDMVLMNNESKINDNAIQIQLEESINNVSVEGDPELLKICIETLVDNAIKYSKPGGKVYIRALKKNNKMIVEVEDEGNGFSTEVLDKIFVLFGSGEKHFDESTGLSLTLVKMIMEAHHGSCEVGNNSEKGAFVRLVFAG